MSAPRVVAGVVTFNPDIPRLLENLGAIAPQVERVVVVDNASSDLSWAPVVQDMFARTEVIRNRRNGGIAVALNQIVDWARADKADLVVLLDQDSVSRRGMVEQLAGRYTKGVAIVAPVVVDRNLGLDKAIDADQEIDYCITSGSLIDVKAWAAVGGYDEKFFIDFVDFDYCLRVKSSGFRIVRACTAEILHEIGHAERRWRFTAWNHSPFRNYHMARDMLLYAQKHRSAPKELRVQGRGVFGTYLVLVRKCLIVVAFERDRWLKVKALCRGMVAASWRPGRSQ